MLSIANTVIDTVARNNPLVPVGKLTLKCTCSILAGRRVYANLLSKLEQGQLTSVDETKGASADAMHETFGQPLVHYGKPLRAQLTIKNETFYARLVAKADLVDIEDLIVFCVSAAS